MKRLMISRLMDEYTDTEFFPTGGTTADPEAVKGWVLANAKTPAKKKQVSTRKKVLFASALAAVMAMLLGAGFPYIQHHLVDGVLFFEQTLDSRITGFVHYGPVMELENDRLFFTQNDSQRLDVTDLISEETPYIYDGSNPDDGMTYYIILGGTPENYGYLEWVTTPDPFDYGDDPLPMAFDESGRRMQVVYAFTWVTYETGERYCSGIGGSSVNAVQMEDVMKCPWLVAGLTQLGIPFEDSPEISGGSGNLPQ